MRHAQEGYATMSELGASSSLDSSFADVITGSPDQVLEQAREKGCALIVTDSDQAGLIVAALIGARTAHRVLPPRPEPEAVSALLGYLGLERYEQLVLLEALPSGGGKNDLPPLIEAGVVNPEQLAALTARIAQSGYASSVDIGSLRQFLADQKEGAGENKTARQIQQAREAARAAAEKEREAARAAAEKERVEAEEKEQRDAQRTATWEKVKTWATGIGVVLTVILVVWIMRGSSTECPSCKKWFGQVALQRQEIGRSTRYETENKVEKYRNTKGEVIMTKERQEQVLYIYVRYQQLNQCKFCSYQWMTELERKYKG